MLFYSFSTAHSSILPLATASSVDYAHLLPLSLTMSNYLSPDFDQPMDSQVAQELFKFLISESNANQNHAPFVWDPTRLETEAYLQTLEQDWSDADPLHFATFVSQLEPSLPLDSVPSESSPPATPQRSLKDALQQTFPQLPAAVVQHLIQQTQTLAASSLSLGEQLIWCIQDLFPQWSVEDLNVLVRPYAYAFRGAPQTQVPAPEEQWEDLSGLMQIRLCLRATKAILEDTALVDNDLSGSDAEDL